MLSLSSPPGRTERSISLAHAGEANPTYGEHVCSCAALSATRGLQVDVCYKRPPVCYEIISEAPNQTTDALISAIACWKWGDSCCRTETIHETSLRTSSGPRGRSKCRGKRQKPAVNPFAVLPCSRCIVFFLTATCMTLNICWNPHSQSTRKWIYLEHFWFNAKMLSGSASHGIKWYATIHDTATQKKEFFCEIAFLNFTQKKLIWNWGSKMGTLRFLLQWAHSPQKGFK